MGSTEKLPLGPFSGPVEFASVIRQAIARADLEGWQEMVWSDATYEDWPLYEKP